MYFTTRRLRLASGLVLFTYIVLHLTNHALGLWSLPAAETGLRFTAGIWQSLPGTVALYGAALVHVVLAVNTIYQRRHWRLPPIEIVRLWAGFSLPLLLIGHFVRTRMALGLYHVHVDYEMVVRNLAATGSQGWQVALLAPGWVHGCLGLWLSLRRFALMRRLRPVLLTILILVPLLSAAGFAHMDEVVGQMPPAGPPSVDGGALAAWTHMLIACYLGLLAAAAAAGLVRNRLQPRRS